LNRFYNFVFVLSVLKQYVKKCIRFRFWAKRIQRIVVFTMTCFYIFILPVNTFERVLHFGSKLHLVGTLFDTFLGLSSSFLERNSKLSKTDEKTVKMFISVLTFGHGRRSYLNAQHVICLSVCYTICLGMKFKRISRTYIRNNTNTKKRVLFAEQKESSSRM